MIRCSKRVLQQLHDKKNGTHRITALVANDTADAPDLVVKTNKLANGMVSANLNLQMNE